MGTSKPQPKSKTDRAGLYVALSGHGFGHLSRTGGLLQDLHDACGQLLRLHVCAGAQATMAGDFLPPGAVVRDTRLDTGVTQRDSFQIDWTGTVQALDELAGHAGQIISQEAAYIRDQGLGLVLGDVPPLATAIARAAGVPCWLLGNFGWDAIFEAGGRQSLAGGQSVAARLREHGHRARELYLQAERFFLLPFHDPTWAARTYPGHELVGIVGQRPRRQSKTLAAQLQLDENRHYILVTFGGGGIKSFPYEQLAAAAQVRPLSFITFDRELLRFNQPRGPRAFVHVSDPGIRVCDLLPLCWRVLTKPGYGILTEAAAAGTELLLLERGQFPETAVLMRALDKYQFPYRTVTTELLDDAHWDFLWADLPSPTRGASPHQPLEKNGNETIVGELLRFFSIRWQPGRA